MSNWRIGQDIVAIRTHIQGYFKEGDTFTVEAIKRGLCPCCPIMLNIGMKRTQNRFYSCSMHLVSLHEQDDPYFFGSLHFSPLDSLADISELTEVLNEPAFQTNKH